jgi:hypothetical protein
MLPLCDLRKARVLVAVKSSIFQQERNGASLKTKASTLSFSLDTAVVVIDGPSGSALSAWT